MPSKDDECGALWDKTAQRSGDQFMSGRIRIGDHDVEVVIFRNSHKQPGERTPDWRVYRSQPRDGGQQAPPPLPPRHNAYREQRNAGARPLRPETELNDDIPW